LSDARLKKIQEQKKQIVKKSHLTKVLPSVLEEERSPDQKPSKKKVLVEEISMANGSEIGSSSTFGESGTKKVSEKSKS
jgi:hypothetical protein